MPVKDSDFFLISSAWISSVVKTLHDGVHSDLLDKINRECSKLYRNGGGLDDNI